MYGKYTYKELAPCFTHSFSIIHPLYLEYLQHPHNILHFNEKNGIPHYENEIFNAP